MAVATSTAIIASAIIGAGTASVAANRAENTADEEAAKVEKARREAEEKALQIERDTRPEGETAEGIKFGATDDGELGSVSDFLVPKTTTALGTAGGSGLGFSV